LIPNCRIPGCGSGRQRRDAAELPELKFAHGITPVHVIQDVERFDAQLEAPGSREVSREIPSPRFSTPAERAAFASGRRDDRQPDGERLCGD